MNLAGLLRRTASEVPGKPALVAASGGRALTYAELDGAADDVARGLAARGVEPGDRVAIGMHNVPHFASAYFGCLRAGAVVVPLNVMLTAAETAKILRDSGPRVVLCAPPFAKVVGQAVGDAGDAEVISTDAWAKLTQSSGEAPDIDVSEDDLAVLGYTSGTTGEPKGVMLTHGNLVANLQQQMSIPDAHVTRKDVVFLILPLFHIFGLNVTLGLVIMNGATGVLVERFEPIQALRSIQDHRITILFGAPTMYSAWVDTPGADQYDLSSVRLAVSGAAPLSEETLRSFEQIFGVKIYEGYGLTETAPTLTSNRMADEPRAGSIGKPLPDVELRLVDDEGKDVELGDPGEIVVRGPNVFAGYWGREEETALAFVDGWFRTGDVAVRDEDGYLYLVDRKRDLVIVSGFNVFPSEVEEALLQSPKVKEAAVVGVPHPYTGEAVKAYVVLADGATASEPELIAEVESRLARFKSPQAVEIVDSLPHLLTGKVLRRALRT
ncbi:MAG: long-chain-fatty-acid--CoA ligase [Actinomycetota bacterium]